MNSGERLGCQTHRARCGFRCVKVAWDSPIANIEDEGQNERQIGSSKAGQDDRIRVRVCFCMCVYISECVAHAWTSVFASRSTGSVQSLGKELGAL